VKKVLSEKEEQKQTAVQREHDRRRTCAMGVLHLLLREIEPSTELSLHNEMHHEL